MEILIFLIGGFLGGFVCAWFSDIFNRTYGTIFVDHKNNLCRVKITSEELNDRKTKKAVFKVYHSDKTYEDFDVDISRDEQGL